MRDTGGGNLAIGVVALVALLGPMPLLARTLGLVAGVPHRAHHPVHRDPLGESRRQWSSTPIAAD